MKVSGLIIIWACINFIGDTRVLGYVIDPSEHWDDSRSLYSNSGLQTEEVDGLNKPVVVLVPVDRNTNRDRTNEADSKSITHPAHKTKRCKSLTPLRKVRLSAPVKEVNNDESESQSGYFMNKNEVAFPSSKLRDIAPVDDEEIASMSGISIPRYPKNVEEDAEDSQQNLSPDEDDQRALVGNRLHQQKKNKFLCYCIDKECVQNPIKPSYQRNKNRVGPKLLQNTDLYSQQNALDSQETLGMKPKASRPIIAYRKQGRKQSSNKRPNNRKCIPIIVPTDNPMKVRLPLTPQSNRRPKPGPAPMNPYHGTRNNYQAFQSALRIPNVYPRPPYGVNPLQTPYAGNQRGILDQRRLGSPYGVIYDDSLINSRQKPLYSSKEGCIPFYGQEFCNSPQALLPQYQFPNNYFKYGLEDTSTPSNRFSPGDCQQNILGAQYGATTPNYYPQLNAQTQFPVVGSRYAGYTDPGYDNYLEDQAMTGVVDSSTEYIMRLPEDYKGYGESSNDYGDDVEEESQVESSHQQYVGAPNDGSSGASEVESKIESPNVSQKDSSKLGQPNNVIVQPGYTHHDGKSGGESSSKVKAGNTNQEKPADDENVSASYDEYVQDSTENPVAPEANGSNGAIENPLGASHDYEEIDQFAVEGDKQSSLHPGEEKPHPGPPILGDVRVKPQTIVTIDEDQLGAPKDDLSRNEDQSVPSIEETSGESPIISKSNDPATSIHSTKPQEARQPAEATLTTLEDDETESQVVGTPLNPQQSVTACPNPETVSALADKHLHDLKALTGLSIEDSKLLRGTIYEAINRLASDLQERAEARRVSSPCDIIGAPEPEAVQGLGGMPLIGNLLNTPVIRNLVVNTTKNLIPQVTGVTKNSALGQLTDTVLDDALTVVLGEEDLENGPEEPTLGVVNENFVSIPEQIMTILKSLINRPGIGLINARLPGVQNIIVRTLENILLRTKNVVDNSIIWSALNDIISQGAQPPIVSPVAAPRVPEPVIPRPVAPSFPREHDAGETKPLPYIPVTEHYFQNGEWHESSATVGYKDEFPEGRLGASNVHADVGESEDKQSIDEARTLGSTPTTYHSPQNIMQQYRKDHPVDQGNVESPPSENSTEDPSDCHDSVSERPMTQEYMGGDYGRDEGSINIPVLGQSQGANGQTEGADNIVGSPISIPTYLGKITTGSKSTPIDHIRDLEDTDLFYIGDGVRLPLIIKRMNDGSLALMLSPKICPCNANDEMRIGRQVEEKVHSRSIRSTTIHNDDPVVTMLPVEKFTKKYNLTLNSEDNKGQITRRNGKSEKKSISNSSFPRKKAYSPPESQTSTERNQYIQDLLSIHDASDTDRTAIVINALDGLLNPSRNSVWPNGRKKSINTADGFEYQLENPIMERIKYIKGQQLEHGRYKYQQIPDEAASARMEVAKNILHTMKELIVEPKANEIR